MNYTAPEQTRPQSKPRNHAFDLLCGLCILRMMLHHITGLTGQNTEWWNTLYYWSFYFMPFFFFKAGYFNKTIGGDSAKYCIDKAKRLLIPYFAWGIIGNICYFGVMPFVVKRYHHPVEPLEWSHIWNESSFYGNAPIWFLLSFFCAYIIMHFMRKASTKTVTLRNGKKLSLLWIQWTVLLFPAISWWLFSIGNPLFLFLNNIFFGVFIFFLGHAWHWLLARMRRRNTLMLSIIITVAFCILNVAIHGQYNMMNNKWMGNPYGMVINTTLALCGLSGILLSLNIPRVPWLNFIGQHSMVFFVAHYPMLTLYRFITISNGRSLVGRLDDFIILCIIIPCLCAWLVPYVEKIPWLSGRFPKK